MGVINFVGRAARILEVESTNNNVSATINTALSMLSKSQCEIAADAGHEEYHSACINFPKSMERVQQIYHMLFKSEEFGTKILESFGPDVFNEFMGGTIKPNIEQIEGFYNDQEMFFPTKINEGGSPYLLLLAIFSNVKEEYEQSTGHVIPRPKPTGFWASMLPQWFGPKTEDEEIEIYRRLYFGVLKRFCLYARSRKRHSNDGMLYSFWGDANSSNGLLSQTSPITSATEVLNVFNLEKTQIYDLEAIMRDIFRNLLPYMEQGKPFSKMCIVGGVVELEERQPKREDRDPAMNYGKGHAISWNWCGQKGIDGCDAIPSKDQLATSIMVFCDSNNPECVATNDENFDRWLDNVDEMYEGMSIRIISIVFQQRKHKKQMKIYGGGYGIPGRKKERGY